MRFSSPALTALFVMTLCASDVVKAQQPVSVTSTARERGIEFYNQGDTKSAIKTLEKISKKHPDDAESCYYLYLY
jgi:outer membrane protein assembly factor BamD (BamD/ComL family)